MNEFFSINDDDDINYAGATHVDPVPTQDDAPASDIVLAQAKI